MGTLHLVDSVLQMSITATWLIMFKSPLIFYLLALSSIGKGILNLISNFNVCWLYFNSITFIYFWSSKIRHRRLKCMPFFFFKFYLVVLGLSCGTQYLCCIMLDLSLQLCYSGSAVAALGLQSSVLSCSMACGILVSQAGMAPVSPALQGKFLTTRLPEKSLNVWILDKVSLLSLWSDL